MKQIADAALSRVQHEDLFRHILKRKSHQKIQRSLHDRRRRCLFCMKIPFCLQSPSTISIASDVNIFFAENVALFRTHPNVRLGWMRDRFQSSCTIYQKSTSTEVGGGDETLFGGGNGMTEDLSNKS
ncbi:hypothetical protein CEXT_465741 [Caerostris extrusa]|uniref:Uncharacterized protein n=1 Tax=Caerostris extrusa TaxID=172846 RepID=A0AAV4PSZ9_CAEEX|nr:hypothetical protein CEXT_465741 [Caerostris extrusa]